MGSLPQAAVDQGHAVSTPGTITCDSLAVGYALVVTLAEAAQMAKSLPEVTEGARYGHRTWLVAGKAFAWERPFSKADIRRFGSASAPDGPILAVRAEDLGDKEAVLAAHPECVFTIPHFDGFAAVLIQLEAATKFVLRELIVDGWLAIAPPAVADAYLKHQASRQR
jgi:hypothetical protein